MAKCRHEWREVKRCFNPPPAREVKLARGSEALYERLVFGFTAVELQCVKCCDVTSRVLNGDLTRG